MSFRRYAIDRALPNLALIELFHWFISRGAVTLTKTFGGTYSSVSAAPSSAPP